MTKQTIIERTVKSINELPEDKAVEISIFADFLVKRYEEQKLTNDLQKIVSESHSFDFLADEEDLYSEEDLKEVYNE